MRTLILFLALALLPLACASAPRPPEVETVGQLAASETHVMSQPVHETTDLARGSFVASDADDAPVAAVVGEAVEAPEVAAKGGLVMGGVR